MKQRASRRGDILTSYWSRNHVDVAKFLKRLDKFRSQFRINSPPTSFTALQSSVFVNPFETSIQGQIVSNRVLPASITQLIIRESVNNPVINVLNGELLCR